MNAHWGEQITFGPGNRISVQMVSQGLDQAQAQATWAPFVDHVRSDPALALSGLQILAFPACHFWDPAFLGALPGIAKHDDRPGAPAGNLFWASTFDEAGQVLHGYHSAWLPSDLLAPSKQGALIDALVAHTRLSNRDGGKPIGAGTMNALQPSSAATTRTRSLQSTTA